MASGDARRGDDPSERGRRAVIGRQDDVVLEWCMVDYMLQLLREVE